MSPVAEISVPGNSLLRYLLYFLFIVFPLLQSDIGQHHAEWLQFISRDSRAFFKVIFFVVAL